jgi:hypothetical protein
MFVVVVAAAMQHLAAWEVGEDCTFVESSAVEEGFVSRELSFAASEAHCNRAFAVRNPAVV